MSSTLFASLPRILQKTYFSLNPLNPNNTEDNYQELLRKNLEIKGFKVSSEVSVQKTTIDMDDDVVKLKNKSERHDLTIDNLSVVMELKNLVDLDESCVNQLLHYMEQSNYLYGILINFAKYNKKREYRYSYRIYKRDGETSFTDSHGDVYVRGQFTMIHEGIGENYGELLGSQILS